MKAHEMFRKPNRHAATPRGAPVDWMTGGSCDPEAGQAYGFNEAQVAQAAVTAYYEALGDGADRGRGALLAALVGHFTDELHALNAKG